MKRLYCLSLLIFTAVIATGAQGANVPPLMNFQTVLTPPVGPVQAVFAIYATETEGTAIWGEVRTITTDGEGRLDIMLGEVVPLTDAVFDEPDRWLGLTIGTEAEMTPRIRLTTVPYAFRISTIDGASGGQVVGNLGINTTPTAALHIGGTPGVDGLRFPDGTLQTTASAGGGAGGWVDEGTTVRLETSTDVVTVGDGSTSSGKIVIDADVPHPPFVWESAEIRLYDGTKFNASLSTTQQFAGGVLQLGEGQYTDLVHWEADSGGSGSGGFGRLRNSLNQETVLIDGAGSTANGGELQLNRSNGSTALYVQSAEAADQGAVINMYHFSGMRTMKIDADEAGQGANIQLYEADGTRTVKLDGQSPTGGGALYLCDAAGTTTGSFLGDNNGDSWLISDVVQITGGSDLSEQFDVGASSEGTIPEPGMVVVIDPSTPGNLLLSNRAFDRTVAGIISGAGGIAPGMLMGDRGSIADGRYPVALTGRVYCFCDASYGAIQPGDLLTTSDTPGHAMKVADFGMASGAIIGKAMTSLESGTGLVLVLVGLN